MLSRAAEQVVRIVKRRCRRRKFFVVIPRIAHPAVRILEIVRAVLRKRRKRRYFRPGSRAVADKRFEIGIAFRLAVIHFFKQCAESGIALGQSIVAVVLLHERLIVNDERHARNKRDRAQSTVYRAIARSPCVPIVCRILYTRQSVDLVDRKVVFVGLVFIERFLNAQRECVLIGKRIGNVYFDLAAELGIRIELFCEIPHNVVVNSRIPAHAEPYIYVYVFEYRFTVFVELHGIVALISRVQRSIARRDVGHEVPFLSTLFVLVPAHKNMSEPRRRRRFYLVYLFTLTRAYNRVFMFAPVVFLKRYGNVIYVFPLCIQRDIARERLTKIKLVGKPLVGVPAFKLVTVAARIPIYSFTAARHAYASRRNLRVVVQVINHIILIARIAARRKRAHAEYHSGTARNCDNAS